MHGAKNIKFNNVSQYTEKQGKFECTEHNEEQLTL